MGVWSQNGNRIPVTNLSLVNLSSIHLKWGYEPSGFSILTDGNFSGTINGSSANITMVTRRNVIPNLTGSQKNTLRDILRVVASTGRSLSISADSADLAETAQAMYRNLLG